MRWAHGAGWMRLLAAAAVRPAVVRLQATRHRVSACLCCLTMIVSWGMQMGCTRHWMFSLVRQHDGASGSSCHEHKPVLT